MASVATRSRGSTPKPLEGLAHPPRVVGERFPVGPDRRAVWPSGDNLAIPMLPFGVIHQPHDPERPVLHCAEGHRRLPQKRRIMPQKCRCEL